MAAATRWALCLCLGWGCLCLALGDALRAGWAGLRRRGGRRTEPEPDERRRPERPEAGDEVSEHMLRLYDQYSGGGGGGGRAAARPRDPSGQLRRGNTVRGLRPVAAGECGDRRRPEGKGCPGEAVPANGGSGSAKAPTVPNGPRGYRWRRRRSARGRCGEGSEKRGGKVEKG